MEISQNTLEATKLVEALTPLLAAADALGFEAAARHIDEAIIALGGVGTPPPEI